MGHVSMKIAILGPSDAGKDCVAEYLRDRWGFTYWGSTSQVILPIAAARLGISEAEAFACRHKHRPLWRAIGDELRRDDPAYLARRTLEHGDLCVGVRARIEIEAVIAEGLCSLILWVDRDVPPDDTLEYGPDLADIILPNRGSLADLHRRLDRLATTWGLRRLSSATPSSTTHTPNPG